jgi:5-methylcytosine-specific restriction endonuclease McrA
MVKKAVPNWFAPGWVHRQIAKHGRKAKLRALHGDNCWRCNRPMRFDGPPNRGKAATIEHLNPRAKGGTWALSNLRLCHVGCNRHLAHRTPEQKERMRINLAAET